MMPDLHKKVLVAMVGGIVLGWFLTAFVFYPPHAGWSSELKIGDLATWVAAFGTLGAVVVALRIASGDRLERRKQKAEMAFTAAQYLYADVQRLLVNVGFVYRFLHDLADVKQGTPYTGLLQHVETTVDQIRQVVERASMERISLLPADVGGQLARSMGGIQIVLDSIQSTVGVLRLNLPLDIYRDELRKHADVLKPLVRPMRPFFVWFAEVVPDGSESVSAPCLQIIDAIAGKEEENSDHSERFR